ncbi:hypothetical protein F2Q69_00035135 [Brassica cretica]|uniref:Uncharacterized protein n=1 Tax=Brassica cretica TaxID=69181 RepID=A0A8S9SMB8_BRACR|nr:hypothetical protein F2Q69_00035135 [Brassica cretica]
MPPVYCGLFDQYSRLQTPVARALFDGAIRLLFPRRVSSRRRWRLLTGFFPVLLICVSGSSLPYRLSFLSLDSSLPRLVMSRFIFGLLLNH